MRFYEFATKTIKPLTPAQARLNSLKLQKDRVSTQLKAERERQKRDTALANIQKSNQVLSKLRGV